MANEFRNLIQKEIKSNEHEIIKNAFKELLRRDITIHLESSHSDFRVEFRENKETIYYLKCEYLPTIMEYFRKNGTAQEVFDKYQKQLNKESSIAKKILLGE